MNSFRRALAKPALAAVASVVLLSLSIPSARLHAQPPPAASGAPSSDSATQQDDQLPTQETAIHRDKAKEEAESSEEEEVRNSAGVRSIAHKLGLTVAQVYWICVLINFGIVLFALVYGLRKKLPGVFASRTEAIQKHIAEARRTGEEARRRMGEVEARLSRLDVEIEAMRRQAEENARAEEHRIHGDTEEERKRIVASAEQEIAMAASTARRDLKGFAAELAVDLAAKKIRVGGDTDQALVREFTSSLGKDGN